MRQLVDLIMIKYRQMGHTKLGEALGFTTLATIKVDGERLPYQALQDGIDEAVELGWLKLGQNQDFYALTAEGAAQF